MERIRRCLSCMEVYEDHLNSCPFCGYKEPKIWDDQLILQPGTILQGRYIVGTKREEGETDITYIGWDGLFDRKVLIQEFFPNRIAKRDSAGKVYPLQGAEADLQRWTNEFVRQREKLILLCESRDVICVFSAFKENGTGYMTYQYADSPVLSEFIKEHGPISTELSKAYLEQAVKAVREVHSLGLIHGGISPDSFWMIQGDRRMVLKGFSEPCHSCGRTDLEDYGKAGPWTDIRGLALLFASLLSGVPRIDEKSALAVFAKTKMLSDVERKALSKALSVKSGQPGITLTEFSRAVLGERRTEELTTHAGNTRKKRSSKREDLRTKLLIGGVALIAGLLAMMAGVTAARSLMNRSSAATETSDVVKGNIATGSDSVLEEDEEETEESPQAETEESPQTEKKPSGKEEIGKDTAETPLRLSEYSYDPKKMQQDQGENGKKKQESNDNIGNQTTDAPATAADTTGSKKREKPTKASTKAPTTAATEAAPPTTAPTEAAPSPAPTEAASAQYQTSPINSEQGEGSPTETSSTATPSIEILPAETQTAPPAETLPAETPAAPSTGTTQIGPTVPSSDVVSADPTKGPDADINDGKNEGGTASTEMVTAAGNPDETAASGDEPEGDGSVSSQDTPTAPADSNTIETVGASPQGDDAQE